MSWFCLSTGKQRLMPTLGSRADANWPEGARNMGKNDIWIAATALHTGLPLLTTDEDFRFLDGVLLQVFWIDPAPTSQVVT